MNTTNCNDKIICLVQFDKADKNNRIFRHGSCRFPIGKRVPLYGHQGSKSLVDLVGEVEIQETETGIFCTPKSILDPDIMRLINNNDVGMSLDGTCLIVDDSGRHNIVSNFTVTCVNLNYNKPTDVSVNLLKRVRCYLAGQMQYFDGAPWRTHVEREMEKMGITVFNPYDHPFINCSPENSDVSAKVAKLIEEEKYDEASKIVRPIRKEDLRSVDLADFIFCYINPTFPTCGAWEEFFWANRMKKPIFLVVEGGKKKTPLWVFGTIPHKYIYNNIEEALTVIRNIDNGTKEIDSNRFRLLKNHKR